MRLFFPIVTAAVLLAACTQITDYYPAEGLEDDVDIQSSQVADIAMVKTAVDPYLWMEEVQGKEVMAWVDAQNKRSLDAMDNISIYQDNYAKALDLATSDDRIPYGSVRDGMVYNFWQDQNNVRGLWRRACARRTLGHTSYATRRDHGCFGSAGRGIGDRSCV